MKTDGKKSLLLAGMMGGALLIQAPGLASQEERACVSTDLRFLQESQKPFNLRLDAEVPAGNDVIPLHQPDRRVGGGLYCEIIMEERVAHPRKIDPEKIRTAQLKTRDFGWRELSGEIPEVPTGVGVGPGELEEPVRFGFELPGDDAIKGVQCLTSRYNKIELAFMELQELEDLIDADVLEFPESDNPYCEEPERVEDMPADYFDPNSEVYAGLQSPNQEDEAAKSSSLLDQFEKQQIRAEKDDGSAEEAAAQVFN